jgi:hypothetical protein
MATSGSFNTNTAENFFGKYRVQFSWELVSQDSVAKTSTISWKAVAYNDKGSFGCLFTSGQLLIDGNKEADLGTGYVNSGDTIASGTKVISHGSYNAKTFTAQVDGALEIEGIYSASVTGKASFELPAIPRTVEITSVSDTTLGNACFVRWTSSVSQKYKIKFALGNWNFTTGFISPGVSGNYTYNGYVIPLDVARQILSSKTGTMTATLYTYNSTGTQIGTGSSKTFTVTVPESLGPFAKMAVSAVNTLGLYSIDDIYIQGQSKARVSFAGSSAQYGASIASCSFSLDGKNYSVNSAGNIDSDAIISSGQIEIKGTVTDSRGYSASVAQTIEVYSYNTPTVVPFSGNMVVVRRENKTQLRIEAGKKYSDLGGNNLCTLSYRYAKSGNAFPSVWTEILGENSAQNAVSFIAAGVTLDEKSSYTIELKAEDALGEKGILSFAVSTEEIDFQLKKGRASFGKYAEEDGFDVGWDATFRKSINGAFIKTKILSTTSFGITMTGTKQSVLIFGFGYCGVLNFDGTSTTWTGNGSVSCSTSGKTATVTVPSAGTLIAISGESFDI